MPILLIAGNMLDQAFQEARLICDDLLESDAALQVEVRSMVEADWMAYLTQKKRELRGRAFQHDFSEPLVIHSVLGYLGGLEGLIRWAVSACGYKDVRQEAMDASVLAEFKRLAEQEFDSYIRKSPHKFCFFEFAIKGAQERVTFELFTDKCPRTCSNFLALCTGEKQVSTKGTTLHYHETPIHRIVKDAWIQGGDIVNRRGDGSESIWGDTFPDESFAVRHDGPGILSMASNGPHTNGSQFFITLRELPCFDTKRVAFGRVVVGHKVLQKMNEVECSNQRPNDAVTICNCGVVEPAKQKAAKTTKVKASANPSKTATFVVIGLDNAGKSTIVNHFIGEPESNTSPTVGFEINKADVGDFKVSFFGLGGGSGIRGYWDNYYDEVHGVIYVVDAADVDRLDETAEAAKHVLSHSKVAGKPILFYLNKQDLKNPLSSTELALKVSLDTDSGLNRIFNTTALVSASGGEPDGNIDEGLSWLLGRVAADYGALQARIQADVAERKRLDKIKREQMKAKYAK